MIRLRGSERFLGRFMGSQEDFYAFESVPWRIKGFQKRARGFQEVLIRP